MQRIAIIGTGYTPSASTAPPREIAAVAASGFKPELVEPRFGAFPDTPLGRSLMTLGNVDAGIEAAKAGFAAVYLNTFGDYGLAELRSALSIPVVGAGEAAMSLSTMFGQRFAIVTIWPRSLDFIYRERLAACGMTERCVGIRYVLEESEVASTARGAQDDPVTQMRAGVGSVLDRIAAAAERAIAKTDADVIVLGCTCMGPIADKIAARLDVPVIDAMTAGYKAAETMLSLKMTHGHRAYPKASPLAVKAIDQLVSGRGDFPILETECEVCAVATEAAAE